MPFYCLLGVLGGLLGALWSWMTCKLLACRARHIPASRPVRRVLEVVFVTALTATVSAVQLCCAALASTRMHPLALMQGCACCALARLLCCCARGMQAWPTQVCPSHPAASRAAHPLPAPPCQVWLAISYGSPCRTLPPEDTQESLVSSSSIDWLYFDSPTSLFPQASVN